MSLGTNLLYVSHEKDCVCANCLEARCKLLNKALDHLISKSCIVTGDPADIKAFKERLIEGVKGESK